MRTARYDWKLVFSLAFTALMILLTIYSLYFGISPHDEAFYVTLPYRFALGDRPFSDEYIISQTASFFILPFIKLFLYIKNSTDGIMLFSRYLHFIATFFLASFIFYVFNKIAETWAALLIAVCYIVFTPFNIHGLSYNTLATLFITTGFFLVFLAQLKFQENSNRTVFLKITFIDLLSFIAGIVHAFAIISYPPLIILPFIFALCALFYLPKTRFLLAYGMGLLIGGSWFIIIALQTGIEPFIINYNYVRSFGVHLGGISKLLLLKKQYLGTFPHKTMVGLLFLLGFFLKKKQSSLLALIPFLILLTLLPHAIKMNSYSGSMFFLINIAFITPLFYLLVRDKENGAYTQALILIWLPSFIIGLFTSWVSSNGSCNNIIGSLPGALVGIFYITKICAPQRHWVEKDNSLIFSTISLLTLLIIIMSLQYFNLRYTYEDLSPPRLTTKLNNGPFKGIFTTSSTCIYYTQLANDIKNVEKQNFRILFFDDFPAGYLFTSMRPATNTTWLFTPMVFSTVDRNATIKYLQHNNIWPNIVFEMRHIPSSFPDVFYTEKEHDSLVNLTLKYHLVLSRDNYLIYQRGI